MLRGKLVGLVAIEREDLEQLMEWRNKIEFRKFFREYRELNMAQQEKWFEEIALKDSSSLMFSIKRNSDNQLLGCCGLVYIDWVHRHADFSLYIGWNDTYIDNEGFAKDACEILLKYAFHELGLNKVWTEIYTFDAKKQALFKELEFHQDGLLRKNYFYEGKWWDSRILSLLKEDY
jgi:RimJ/RimL family protein N-acetyltransferase